MWKYIRKLGALIKGAGARPAGAKKKAANGSSSTSANGSSSILAAANGTTNGSAANGTAATQAPTALQQWKVEEPYLNIHCSLGEGPYYEKATKTLRFVDIIQRKIHTVSLEKGPESLTTLAVDSPVGVTADIAGVDPQEKLLVGLKFGLAVLDRKTGTYEYISKYGEADNDRLRGNDGAADPQGRFWIGIMTDFHLGPCQPEGSLLKFSNRAAPATALKDLTIPNSVGWSPDFKTMYFTHSTAQQVIAFDYAPTGELSNQRVFYQHKGNGDPDGFRVDLEGNIWHAVYGEFRVLKISPQGKLIGEILLPTRNITCVEFVGTELYITTANDENAEGGEKSKELGGALFKVDVGVGGVQPHEFKLEA